MRKTHIWRSCCAWALCGALLSTAVPQVGWTQEATPGSEANPIEITADTDGQWGTAGTETWYTVEGLQSIDTTRPVVQGTVHLTLIAGSALNVAKGIDVSEGQALIIDGSGSLTAKGTDRGNAGIGGSDGNAGTITINGGTFDVRGGANAAGIGGGANGTGGTIVINDCQKIGAVGENAAAIGGGQSGAGGHITINGGNVSARGTLGGAGIGGGGSASGGTIEINGGAIDAQCDGNGGAGIGAGNGSASDGTVKITGGTITASGGPHGRYGGAGIGGGNDGKACPITITGGEIHATGGDATGTFSTIKGGDGIGNGGGYYDEAETAEITIADLDNNGAPVIFATSGSGGSANAVAGSDKAWQGVVFQENAGKVYGDTTLSQSFEIPENTTLTIEKSNTLTVPDGIILTNKGSIVGNGTLIGVVAENQPADTIDRGRVTINAAHSEGGTVSGAGEYTKGKNVTLTATADLHYRFSGWFEGENNVSADASYTFEAESDRTLTAKFEKTAHVFGQWQGDGNGHHIRTCTISGCTGQEQDACSGGTASCILQAVCDTCGGCYGSLDPTNHAKEAAWTTTATTHTSEYTCCGAASGPEAAHSWQDGACAVCGYHCPHALHFVERVDATTSQTGVEAHYACDHCGLLFRDAAGAERVTAEELVIPVQDTPSPTPGKPGVKLEASENGSVDVSTSAPAYRETVTITPVPDAGYHVASVSVTDRRGQALRVTAQDDGSYTYIQPWGMVTINVTFARDAAASVTEIFTDIRPGAWYEDAVQFAYDKGWLTGTSATTFAPDAAATRGMIVSILHRLAGAPAAETDVPFEDVASGAWYADAVRWGVAEGLISGYDDATFGPDDAVTREQFAAMLQRYDQWRGESDGTRSDLSGYEDASAISDWAIDAVAWAHAQGLLTGTSETTLDPQGPAARAQVAAVLQRFPGE